MHVSEEEYVNLVEKRFNQSGWTTHREVVPDGCKTWNYPWRVDLIVYNEEFGYFGFEFKQINMRQGSIIGKALKQIQKYEKCFYFNGNKINNWGIGYFAQSSLFRNQYADACTQAISIFIQGLFNELGYTYLDLLPYQMKIVFNPKRKIEVFNKYNN